MWRPREDVVGVGAVLSALPSAYTPDNIVALIGQLSSNEELNEKTFSKHATKYLGLADAQASMLFGYYTELLRPFEQTQAWAKISSGTLGLFLVLQFLSQFCVSTVTRRKSTMSEVWPTSPEMLRYKPNPMLSMPNAPIRALSERQLSRASIDDALARTHSERNISITDVKDAIANSPFASPMMSRRPGMLDRRSSSSLAVPTSDIMGGFSTDPYMSNTPPQSRIERSMVGSPNTKRRISASALSPLSPPPTNLHEFAAGFDSLAHKSNQWRLTPPKSHLLFPPFQASFLLDHVTVLVRVCLAALGRCGAHQMLRVSSEDVSVLEFLLCYLPSREKPDHIPRLHTSLECFASKPEVSFFDVVSSLSSLLKEIAEVDFMSLTHPTFTQYNFLHRKTVVHDNTFTAPHHLSITNSFRSYIYCATSLGHVVISCITNCTVFVGAVAGILTLQHCSGVILAGACHSVYISNCKDCVVHVACNKNPVFGGDNNNVQLAPLNAFYPLHSAHIEAARLETSVNKWDQPVSRKTTHPCDHMHTNANSRKFIPMYVSKSIAPISTAAVQ
eukprot:c10126_g1_i2.p1 GENE.c10126_g1_i2~~c10126_g1_i2.p1  ORF type:complete len:560 (-),score=106.69 c10126_g1_i2:24-1703(-)